MDAVAEIKAKIDLVEFIGRATPLQKAGRNFRGLCPFHTEKTPSFYVFPDRGTWRCFGSCGEGGDLFTFVQKRNNLEFRAALQDLAREAGIQLSAEGAQRRTRAEHLGRVVSAAVDYYQRQLAGATGEAARAYLVEKRGLTEDTIATFHLGWAPDEWRGLRDHLAGRGYDEADMLAAGLLVQPEMPGREGYDRFRGRVIIPIQDDHGVFVGMGGRGLHGEEPKYLNSPQSDLFDKGRTLFGLNLGAEAIRATGTVVVVEGYMDVMGPWQAGFRNVVATMGTSLTENHVAALKRHAKRVVLAMDPDAAGLAAAERAGGLFVGLDSPEAMARSARSAEGIVGAAGLDLRVATLPPGKDPDEITREDPATWDRAIREAVPFPEFLIARMLGAEPPDSPVEARRLIDRLKPVLNAVSDAVERAKYVQRVARFLGVGEQAVLERVRQRPVAMGRRPQEREHEPASREEILLAILLAHPSLRHAVRAWPLDLFGESVNREVFRRWLADDEHLDAAEDDPVTVRAVRVRGIRLPPLSAEEAHKAANGSRDAILRERLIQRQAAVSEELAVAERTLGARRVSEVASDAWRGGMPPDDSAALAQAAMEAVDLGVSIHRQEAAELG
jgi:DNA primase